MSTRKPDSESDRSAAGSSGRAAEPAKCAGSAADSSQADELIAAVLDGSGRARSAAESGEAAAHSGARPGFGRPAAMGGKERGAAVSGKDAWLAELLSDPGGPPDPARFTALQAELALPERRYVRWPALLVWPLSGLLVIAVRAWIGDRSLFRIDLAHAAPRLSWGITVLAFCAACAVAAALHRGRTGFGLPSAFVRAFSLGLSALIALTPLWLRGAFPQPILHAFGAPCAAVVMVAGALALGVTWWLFRRSQPVGASARALALGAATAAWTGIVISLHCPGESLPHLVWGHSLPLLALVGLAAWLLPRQLQP